MTDLDRERLTEQVRRHEGLRLKPYRDSVGKLTIGYGRNLQDVGILMREADHMLLNDLDLAERECRRVFVGWFPDLDPVRQAVLVNMRFNLGLSRLLTFEKMLKAIAQQQYGQAADEMIDSRWAKQVGPRAVELAAMMKTGRWV